VTLKRLFQVSMLILVGATWMQIARPALACAVCFGGDPNSSMTQGVQSGILVLLGVLCSVLLGFVSLAIFWMRRAANLERLVRADEKAG
jgi:hypothetical protein